MVVLHRLFAGAGSKQTNKVRELQTSISQYSLRQSRYYSSSEKRTGSRRRYTVPLLSWDETCDASERTYPIAGTNHLTRRLVHEGGDSISFTEEKYKGNSFSLSCDNNSRNKRTSDQRNFSEAMKDNTCSIGKDEFSPLPCTDGHWRSSVLSLPDDEDYREDRQSTEQPATHFGYLTCNKPLAHTTSSQTPNNTPSDKTLSSASSRDSGYGTTGKAGRPSMALDAPAHLASLFDPPVADIPERYNKPGKNQSLSLESRHSKLLSDSWRSARLTLSKKLPIRHKIPFHMRYQEWTDLNLSKERRSDVERNPSGKQTTTYRYHIPHVPASQQGDTTTPAPSASSPVYVLDSQNFVALQKKESSPPPSYGVPRRKSTGTLKAVTSTLPSSDNGERLELLDSNGNTVARYVRFCWDSRAESAKLTATLQKLGNSIGKGQFGTVYR